MEKQPMKQPSMEGGRSLQTRPGISIPLSNEIAAVFIGQGLTHPDTKLEARAEAEGKLAQFENFKVVYAQNTADEMNVVVPYFPELECEMEKITEQQLDEIAGGEVVIFVGSVGIFFAKIGVMLGVGSLTVGVSAAATTGLTTVTTVLAGVAAVGLIAGNVALGVSAVATGVGVGIAAAVGAFDGGGSGVSVGHAS
ncbi:MAG: hypothetical protein OXU50_00840 [Gammaproteobacteria bacterium]|nr:hypothetical protein [Gammaproteobacteria bacterium]